MLEGDGDLGIVQPWYQEGSGNIEICLYAAVEVNYPWDLSTLESFARSLGQLRNLYKFLFFSNLCVWLYFPRGKWTACCHFHVLVLHTGLPPAAPYDQCLFPAKLLGPGAHVPEDLLGGPLINSLPALRISLELCVPAPVCQPAKTFNLSWVILTHLYAQSLWVLLKLESQEDPVLAELWLLGLS